MGCINILSGYSQNSHQKIDDALSILVLNLMPNRLETEHQIIDLLKQTDLNINLTFCRMASHHIKHFNPKIIEKYVTTKDVFEDHFDALIVTGAPLDRKNFHDVDYWNEFVDFIKWRKNHVDTCLFSCWAAWAAGTIDGILIGKQLDQKIYGVYTTDGITMPQSRYFTIPRNDVKAKVLAGNDSIGATLIFDSNTNSYYVTGHLEYGTKTLADEYFRDVKKGLDTKKPSNYFDNQDHPINSWHTDATTFYINWLNQFTSSK